MELWPCAPAKAQVAYANVTSKANILALLDAYDAEVKEQRRRIHELNSIIDVFGVIGADGDGWQQMVAALAHEAYYHQTAYNGCARILEDIGELALADLRKYGYHIGTCAILRHAFPGRPCDCGFSARIGEGEA
jgi:hypothetical protein